MIPTIGVMVGGYIFTRMCELAARPDRGKGVKVLAVLTAIVTVFCILDLALSGSSIPVP
jgi:hypothetical protein